MVGKEEKGEDNKVMKNVEKAEIEAKKDEGKRRQTYLPDQYRVGVQCQALKDLQLPPLSFALHSVMQEHEKVSEVDEKREISKSQAVKVDHAYEVPCLRMLLLLSLHLHLKEDRSTTGMYTRRRICSTWYDSMTSEKNKGEEGRFEDGVRGGRGKGRRGQTK